MVLNSYPSECQEKVLELFDERPKVFQGLESVNLQSKYIKEHFNYVPFQQLPLGTTLSKKKKGSKQILCEKEENFIYIPMIESLKQLLSNKRIRSMLLKSPNFSGPGTYYDICDGSLFKSDIFFKTNPKALMIILYHDEVEICNPLGSKSGKHKLDMYYYVIGNLSPKFRSKHCAVRLLAIVNANIVKKYGVNEILKPIVKVSHEL